MTASWRSLRAGGLERAALADGLLLAAAAALLLLPSLLHGAPTGDDYPYHMAWVDAFTAEQSLSRPYPRWLGALWYGAGGADFYFYAPLAYWIAGAIRAVGCAGCGAGTLIVAVGLVALVASGLGFRALGLRFAGRGPALAAAVLYMALPYHLGVDWYHRLALAEFTALAVVPWHLAAFADCLRGRARGPLLAVLSALLALAHLPTAVIVACACAVLFLTLERAPGWRPFATVVLAAALGLGVAAVYWYPAVLLLDSVRNDLLVEFELAVTHWLVPPNLRGEALLAANFAALAGLSVAALAAVLAAPQEGQAEARAGAASIVGLLALAWVMVTPLSWPLWAHSPIVGIQFPWRFLAVADLAVGLAALLAAETLGHRASGPARRLVAAGCLAAIALGSGLAHPVIQPTAERRVVPDPEMPVFPGAFEWLPRESASPGDFVSFRNILGVIRAARAEAREPPVRVQGAGAARVLEAGPRRLEFEAELLAPARVVLHRTYWRFWRLENLETGAEVALAPTPRFPLASAILPAGTARYRLELPVLPEERRGALISALALAALLAWAWLSRPRRRS